MANILGLALKISADASGVQKALTPAERALKQLDTEAASVTAVFDKFASTASGATQASQRFATDLAFLQSALRTGKIDGEQFNAEFVKLKQEATKTADAFAEGARITEQARTVEEQRAETLKRLSDLLELGAISQETFNRASAEPSGANDAAARVAEDVAAAEKIRADVLAEGARVTEQVRTADEKRASELERLNGLLEQGAISQETFNRASAEASGANADAARAEAERVNALSEAERQRSKIVEDGARVTQQFASEEERRAQQLDRLGALLDAKVISEETYAKAVAEATGATEAATKAQAERDAVLSEGSRLAERFSTAEEKRAAELANIDRLLRAGAISEDIAAKARAEASGANESAAKAERERADAFADAARIIQANRSPLERYDDQIQSLTNHLNEGRLSQDQFNRAAEKARGDLESVSKRAKDADDNIDRLNRNVSILANIEIGRLFVGGIQAISNVFREVAGRITSLVANVNAGVDSLNDLSARTGIGVEALQGYSIAAKLAGVDTEQFGAAVQKLAVNIGKATPGDALDKALKGINLSLADLRALSPEQQFSDIGAAISQLPTAADRAAAAVAIFGKQGAALAPLFREGAASIEELQAKAERLGVIISETQVNNVADMNDAFDLVSATINGIIGQVIGNLAPAVTAVTNEFLKFVEEFNGTTGEGGTGIANAITDVLLKGAEYFAGIFDTFVANFGSLGETFSYAADIFDLTSKILLTASEGIRVAFNAIQIGIDVLLMGFGKIVEALGSYVSSDLEQFGAGLAAASEASAKKNAAEMEAAATNAANTFNSIFTGGGDAEAAGQGAGQEFIRGLRSEIENARLPEVQVQADLALATADLDQFLSTAEGGSSVFMQQSQETLTTFSQMAAEGNLTADQIHIMNGFMENLNAELGKEKQNRQAATDAAEAQVEADRKRLDQLLQTNDEAARLEQDLLAVQREQARVSQELAAARAKSDRASADAAAARLAQLDGLRTKLEDQAQAVDQGFAEGFASAFEATAASVSDLVDKAGEFGDAGAEAAASLQAGIEAVQEQVRDGVIPKSAYDKEIENQKRVLDERLAQIEEARRKEQEARDATFAQQVSANERVTAFLNQSTAAEIAAAEEVATRRQQTAFNIEAIEQRLALERQSLEAAREQGDLKSAAAAVDRINQLKEALTVEQQISEGRQQQLVDQKQLVADQQTFQEEQQKGVEEYQKQQQQAQQAYAAEQAKIFDEQRKAADAEAKRQEERLKALNTLGQQSIASQDVRTTEGANLVLQLSASGQDPAAIQARLQTKLLERIALGIGQAASNYFNQPVAIVGASTFGNVR